MKVLIQVWQDQKIISEWDYDPEINQKETIETLAELMHRLENLEPGSGFTLIADRIS